MAIICSAMAVECALTQVFLKWKRIEHERSGGKTSENEQTAWEQEYRSGIGRGGFKNSADFVSEFLIGKKYEDFVSDFFKRSSVTALINAGWPQSESQLRAAHIQNELFFKRNRIMHWGKVNYQKDDAARALIAALRAIAVFKAMDKEKYLAMEQEFREALRGNGDEKPS